MGCRGITCITVVFSTACRDISALAPVGLPPTRLPLIWAGSHFPHSCLSQLLFSVFYTFLNMLLQRCHQCRWWAQLLLVVGPFCSWLEVTVWHGRPCCLFTEATSASPPLPKPCHIHPIHLSIYVFVKLLLLSSSCDRDSNMTSCSWMQLHGHCCLSWNLMIERWLFEADDCHSYNQKFQLQLCNRMHSAEVHRVNIILCVKWPHEQLPIGRTTCFSLAATN